MRSIIRLFCGIISAAVVIFILGWGAVHLGRIYLTVLGNNTQISTSSTDQAHNTNRQVLNLTGFKVYYLQLGVFQEEQNAIAFTNELQLKGIGAVVFQGKPVQVVYGYFGGAAGLHAARLKLISKGIHATEKSTVVNGVSFKVAPGGSDVQVVLTNYAQILAAAAKTFQTASVSKQQIIGLGEQIATLRQDTVQAFTRLKTEKSDPARQRQLNKLQQLGQELDQNINAMKREISQQNYNQTQQTLLYMLDNYREYLRLLQKSPNN